eukprot:Sspe_Gene.102237::Locus_77131_Transcript_1_1_Confidence_1.000_Length_458::g.102237::m.102237
MSVRRAHPTTARIAATTMTITQKKEVAVGGTIVIVIVIVIGIEIVFTSGIVIGNAIGIEKEIGTVIGIANGIVIGTVTCGTGVSTTVTLHVGGMHGDENGHRKTSCS